MSNKPKVLITRAIFDDTVAKLSQYFEVTANQADTIWTRQELIGHLRDQDGVMVVSGERIDAEVLSHCSRLKICANMAVGYNNLDLSTLVARNVIATNTPNVLNKTVADFGFALLLTVARRITEAEAYVRDGMWQKWSTTLLAGADVHGKNLGILGMGRIGQELAKRGKGFDMQVIYHNRNRLNSADEDGAQFVSKNELLQNADFLMLILPYTPQTHHIIGANELAQMKSTAFLINLARGGIVDDNALINTLQNQGIAGAALDVFEGEPKFNPEFLSLKNVVLTPHIASASIATRRAMANLAANNLIAVLSGEKAITPIPFAR